MCVCVCVCVCVVCVCVCGACASVCCVCVCVLYVCVCARARACVRSCVRARALVVRVTCDVALLKAFSGDGLRQIIEVLGLELPAHLGPEQVCLPTLPLPSQSHAHQGRHVVLNHQP